MSEFKGTPGPWKVIKREDEDHGTLVVHEGDLTDFLICQTNQHWGNGLTNGQNARLIASAPDLLEALEYIAKTWPDDFAARHARAAIAKALGKS